MDLSKSQNLKDLILRFSAEGRTRLNILVKDKQSGRVLALNNQLGKSLFRVLNMGRLKLPDGQLVKPEEEELKSSERILTTISALRDQELLSRKSFNPIFLNIPLFDVYPYQSMLKGLSERIVGLGYWIILSVLVFLSVLLGSRNDWSILSVFDDIFSLDALLTFALVAPVLKLFHELGHVLVATKFGVRVRKAGILFIGLYPMPYVDCSDSDFTAPIFGRISISLAGLFVDIAIGLSAFVAWHLVEGNFLRTLLGNIFLYSTLNSVFFNLNPLIKLDGYYAFVDLIGQRNLYSRAQKTLGDATRYLLNLGRVDFTIPAKAALLILYAILALMYRVFIMYTIALAVLPQHLGLGAVIVIWGAIAMFVSPMLQDRMTKSADSYSMTSWMVRFALIGVCAILLIFVKLPFVQSVDVTLDYSSTYSVTNEVDGFVVIPPKSRSYQKDEVIVSFASERLKDEKVIMDAKRVSAEMILDSVRSESASKTLAAKSSLDALQDKISLLDDDMTKLNVEAETQGVSFPTVPLKQGEFVGRGNQLGIFLPIDGASVLVGDYPERYVEKLKDENIEAELKIENGYYDIPNEDLELLTLVSLDGETGQRSYRLRLSFDQPPSPLSGTVGVLKIRFDSKPLYEHVAFWAETVMIKFRESQLLNREKAFSE